MTRSRVGLCPTWSHGIVEQWVLKRTAQHSIIPIVSEANYVLYVSFIVNFESSFFRDAETPGPQPPLTWDPEARVSQTLETRPEGRLLRNKANTSFHPCQG